jgi:OmcA/MtrC family decaheme c-type cytochrome
VPVTLEILAVTNAAAGTAPAIDLRVTKAGAPFDILATPMNALRVTVAGPTTDYTGYWQRTIQGSGASGTLTAGAAAGEFHYVLPAGAEIPAGATGSYAFGLEGRETSSSSTYAFNPVFYAAVGGGAVEPRRATVYANGCNACHLKLAEHGGSRQNPEYCVFCHHPNNTNDERVSRVEGETVTAHTVDFKVMIHKIHRGEELEQPYVLGGFPLPNAGNPAGTPIDFGETRFPGDLRACWTCHAAGSFELPLAQGVLPSRSEVLTCTEDPSADADAYCNTRSSVEVFTAPTTAVCTACHDSPYTFAHAEIMTSAGGLESCTTCHGPGSAFDIARYHALDP